MPINVKTLDLVDAVTRKPVAECLVVPRYTVGVGIVLGDDWEPIDSEDFHIAIGRPFVYRSGTAFEPYEGQIVGFFEAWRQGGDSGEFDGVTLIAPGYEPLWIWDLWHPRHDLRELRPLSPSRALQELKRIRALTSSPAIRGRDRMYWSFAGDGPIRVFFTADEQELVRAFLDSGLALLEAESQVNP